MFLTSMPRACSNARRRARGVAIDLELDGRLRKRGIEVADDDGTEASTMATQTAIVIQSSCERR